jgi:hypothetical protein
MHIWFQGEMCRVMGVHRPPGANHIELSLLALGDAIGISWNEGQAVFNTQSLKRVALTNAEEDAIEIL